MRTIETFVCMPGYGRAHPAAVRQLFRFASRRPHHVQEQSTSLLALNFNVLFCDAAARRAAGEPLKYFVMLHSDVEPEDWWVDKLVDELEATGADVLSAVVPIKCIDGVTSTGVGDPADRWSAYTRITVKQLEHLPPTFSAADLGYPDWPLLVNTGCWVMRLDRDWLRDFPGFSVCDKIEWSAEDGRPYACVEPEDWRASRWFWSRGLKVLATTKIKLAHHGDWAYPNHGDWGCGSDAASRGPLSQTLVAAG